MPNCCAKDFYYRQLDKRCVRNCSRVVDRYALQLSNTNFAYCACDPGFYFNTIYSKCVRNCSRIADPNSSGINWTDPTSFNKCMCYPGYIWRF